MTKLKCIARAQPRLLVSFGRRLLRNAKLHDAGKLKQECTLLIVSHDLRELAPLVSPCSVRPLLLHICMSAGRIWTSVCSVRLMRCALCMQVDYAWEMQPGGKLLPAAWPPLKDGVQ